MAGLCSAIFPNGVAGRSIIRPVPEEHGAVAIALLPTSIVHDSLRDAPLRILPVKLPLQARPVALSP